MHSGDTIVAVATAPLRSHRAIIRISGPACAEIINQLLPGMQRTRRIGPARLALGRQSLPVLSAFFPGPASFTGEDVLEIQLPGGPALVARVMATLLDTPGVRHAAPGEFSARAYLNRRLTIAQAEGIAQAIAATTAEELAAAERLASGATGSARVHLAESLARALALVEATIDFSDQQDVSSALEPEILLTLDGLARAALDLFGNASRETDSAEPVVVIAGAPNAGKSTLFNAVLGQARAIASAAPGTTRDALRERVLLPGASPTVGAVWLIDTPGLDAAPDGPASDAAQRAAADALRDADVVVWCDPTGAFDERSAPAPGPAVNIRVRTKADVAFAGSRHGIALCALDGRGMPDLLDAIAQATASLRPAGTPQARHAQCLRRAHAAIAEARSLLRASGPAPLELVASALRDGLDAMGEITGRIDPDRVLGLVFSRFCIGK